MADDIGFARALACVAVTDRQFLVLVHVGARWIALAWLAILGFPWLPYCSGIAEETRLASLAFESSSIIHAAKALPSHPITVANGIGINISIAVALATGPSWSL